MRISDRSSYVCSSYRMIAVDIGAKSRVQLSIGRDGLQLHVAGQIIFQLPVETPVFDDIEVRARSIGQVRVDATVRVSNDKAIIIGQMLTCLARQDRKSVVEGKSVSVRVGLGGCRIIKKTNKTNR